MMGGLDKIITLIDESRHRKFRSDNLDSSATKKEEWLKLLKFLERELQLREMLTLDHKTAEMNGLFSNRGNSSKDDNNKNEKILKHLSCNQ